jgi:peptidylprolyl isomerase
VLAKNQVAIVEYSIYVKDTGELVDTTSEVEAKLNRKYVEGAIYEPEVVVVGEGRFFQGFEEALAYCREGEEVEVEVPPEKAFGPRDPSKIKIFPRRVFERQNVKPEVGKEVRINGELGRILAIEGGRVVVDFNHPLAGKTLKLKLKVVKVVNEPTEAIRYLVKRRLRGAKPEDIVVKMDAASKQAIIEVPRRFRISSEIQYLKSLAAYDIFKYVEGVSEVVFIDRFTRDEVEGGK